MDQTSPDGSEAEPGDVFEAEVDPLAAGRDFLLSTARRIGRARSPHRISELAEDVVYNAEDDLHALVQASGAVRTEFEAALQHDWRDWFEFVDICTLYVRSVVDHLNTARPGPPGVVVEAFGEVGARGALVGDEILAQLRSGFPRGAHARWRTLYELAVCARSVNSGFGDQRKPGSVGWGCSS